MRDSSASSGAASSSPSPSWGTPSMRRSRGSSRRAPTTTASSPAAPRAVGRTRTAPAPGARTDRLRFAFCSCQNYEDGWYTAFRHMAAEDLELVVHLGDYIYERARHAPVPR